jgi:hypothetical protein
MAITGWRGISLPAGNYGPREPADPGVSLDAAWRRRHRVHGGGAMGHAANRGMGISALASGSTLTLPSRV